ncbi:sugar ABC transporter substrate-binding protein [Paenibacillus baekrokdamisoli]|uniref:Sugar ABC transporter substrate-binding protein n=1 Tax=Paenibacillus baekrokdamisoli TaxID=1712516 RepID=A0A3G9JNE6_9BACL|nr:extracellular solute-binding protein [Paenibacillus baekrokdamisoli]MBB3071407.1 ABC-type glycerol-3-phosphate transport system substrate-binding protein [Paenibacillus baekrokdamisoli]BBH24559.1 sugar ABC transporter substrate-binding protein [Paenibacillus baekrokdamisoli]
MHKRLRTSGKWLSILMVIAMLVITAACGKGNDPKSSTEGESGTPQKTNNAAGSTTEENVANNEPVEITVWDKTKPDDILKPVYDEIFAEFDAKYPNIKVKHEVQPTGTNDREVFVTSMAGGNGPDAYAAAYFPIIGDWVKQGFALDLTSQWQSYADKDQYLPTAMAAGTIDGKVYGIPNNMYTMGLMYNKKLFKAAGLDPDKAPANWDEFVDYAKKLTDPGKNQYGYALLGMDWADWWFEYYVWQAGGDLTTKNADGTVTLDFSKQPTVTALQFYKDLKWKYKAVQKNIVQDIGDNQKDFFLGRVGMILSASDWFMGAVQGGMDLNEVGFSPFPVGPSGKAPSQTGGSYWIINPTVPKERQDAAFTYVAFRNSKESTEKMLKFQSDNGVLPNLLSVRKDVDASQFSKNVPADLVTSVVKTAENVQLEYFLKERLGSYVVKAIQKVLIDEKADPLTELKAAEVLAQREVVDPYNKEIKK